MHCVITWKQDSYYDKYKSFMFLPMDEHMVGMYQVLSYAYIQSRKHNSNLKWLYIFNIEPLQNVSLNL